jgi:hypothetical protein
MSGSTENRTSGSSKSGGQPAAFTWTAAARMLPLAGRIVRDVIELQQRLERMQLEKDRLDRHRHTLAWPERSRRYHLQEEITAAEQALHVGLSELDVLNIVVIDLESGQIGFPTIVNDRPAYFSWLPGEEGLLHWHFAEDTARRPVPASWTKLAAETPRRRSRSERNS